MNGNFHNSRGSSTHAGYQTPRWRNVFIALLIALAISSVGQTPSAQAAPARTNVRLYMEVVNPKTTLCVGESVRYIVKVNSQFTSAPRGWTDKNLPAPFALPRINVDAFSVDKTVGDFIGTRNGSVTRSTGSTDEIVDLVNPNAEPLPHSATFTFKAKKAGRTTLYFEGLADGQYVDFPVPVKVINCKYKVTVISNWFITQGTGGSISLVSFVRWATLMAVSENNFMGESTARWIPNIVLPSQCTHSDTVPPSKVTLTGGINTSDELVVKVVFGTAALTEVGACGPQPIDTTNAMLPDTLEVKVPGAGGTWQGTQLLDTPSGLIPGPVTVIVIPVER